MTVAPPQPGWWMASDGQWYPPEQHPHASQGWWVASDGNWYPPEQRPVAPQTVAGWGAGSWSAPASFSTAPQPFATQPTSTPPSPTVAPTVATEQPPMDSFYAKPSEQKPFWRVTAEEDDTTYPGSARPGWENTVGGGERKGLRTERSAGNYLARSSVMAVVYCGFLIAVLINPNQFWMWIGAPIMIGFRYIFTWKGRPGLLAEVRKRVGYSESGIGWAKESRRGVLYLRIAAALAVLGFVCGMIGNVIFWDTQLVGGGGKGGGSITSILKQQTTGCSSSTSSGSTATTNEEQAVQGTEQCQQSEVNSLLKKIGG